MKSQVLHIVIFRVRLQGKFEIDHDDDESNRKTKYRGSKTYFLLQESLLDDCASNGATLQQPQKPVSPDPRSSPHNHEGQPKGGGLNFQKCATAPLRGRTIFIPNLVTVRKLHAATWPLALAARTLV